MKLAHPMTAMVLLTSACAPSISKNTFAPIDGVMQAVAADVGTRVDTEARAEAAARREAAIRAGHPPYRLLPGCAAQDITLIGAPMSAEDAALFTCAYEEAGTRNPSNAEVTGQLLKLLSEYVAELDTLARSDLPEDVANSGVKLLANTASLATAVGADVSKSRVLAAPATVGRFARFALEQYRARVLRQTVQKAREPFEMAVRLIVAYLLEEGKNRDPVVQTSAALLAADSAMQLSPGNAAVVAAFEAAFAANETARTRSPAVRMMHLLAAHNALADQLAGPPTIEELTALVAELAELRRLLETQ